MQSRWVDVPLPRIQQEDGFWMSYSCDQHRAAKGPCPDVFHRIRSDIPTLKCYCGKQMTEIQYIRGTFAHGRPA